MVSMATIRRVTRDRDSLYFIGSFSISCKALMGVFRHELAGHQFILQLFLKGLLFWFQPKTIQDILLSKMV